MKYDVKIRLSGIEIHQNDKYDESITTPYITGLKVKSSTSLKGLEIGSTASDSIYFTMYNPFKKSFDGEKVELYILPTYSDDEEDKASEIESEVGASSTTSLYDPTETEMTFDLEEQDEGEEELTDAEAEELEEESNEVYANVYDSLQGEEVATEEVTTEEEQEGWQKLGTYFIYSQKNDSMDKSIYFVALDGMSKLSANYVPVRKVCTLQEAYDDYAAYVHDEYGITCDEMDLTGYDHKTFNFKHMYTCRTFIGYLAGILGGFATFGLDDTLGISFYNYSDRFILSDSLIGFIETSSVESTIGSIACDRATSIYKRDLISTEEDPEHIADVTFYNPYIDMELLADIFESLEGVSYIGANVTAKWSPAIESGSFVRIMSDEEYKNYLEMENALIDTSALTEADIIKLKADIMSIGKTILVTNQTIDFAGDCTTMIDSVLPSVYTKEAQITSPNDAKFQHLYSEMIEANYVDAVRVVTEGLTAKDSEIQNLVVGSINGKSVKNTFILAKVLSDEALETVLGIKVYYTAIDPVELGHEVKDGDLWWRTVVVEDEENQILKERRDDDWKDTPLDYHTFRANSVTAQEINVKDLSAIGATIGGWEIDDTALRYPEEIVEDETYNEKTTFKGSLSSKSTERFLYTERLFEKVGSDNIPIKSKQDLYIHNECGLRMENEVTIEYPEETITSLQSRCDIDYGGMYVSSIEPTGDERLLEESQFSAGRIYTTGDIVGGDIKIKGHDTGIGTHLGAIWTQSIPATFNTKNQYYNVATMTLPAGDWMVHVMLAMHNTSTTAGMSWCCFSTTNLGEYAPWLNGQYVAGGGTCYMNYSVPVHYSGPVTLYLSAKSSQPFRLDACYFEAIRIA